MSNFPPSLSKVPPHKPTDRHMARYERQVEKDKKRRERLDAVEAAMKSLPLKTGAESEIPKMKGLFEQAFHASVVVSSPQSKRGSALKAEDCFP